MERLNALRLSILVFFLILFSIFSLRHFLLGGDIAASSMHSALSVASRKYSHWLPQANWFLG